MTARRVARAQDLIREEVSKLLLFKLKDPRLSSVSVTEVKMTADLRHALIRYSSYDEAADRKAIQKSLEQAAGFIRREIGRVVNLKFVPEIQFEFDRSMEYAQHMDKILREIVPEGAAPEAESPEAEAPGNEAVHENDDGRD